jgi:hypothetical protein
LSRVFGKKVEVLIKMESESLMNSGLEIPREYYYIMEEQDENTNC